MLRPVTNRARLTAVRLASLVRARPQPLWARTFAARKKEEEEIEEAQEEQAQEAMDPETAAKLAARKAKIQAKRQAEKEERERKKREQQRLVSRASSSDIFGSSKMCARCSGQGKGRATTGGEGAQEARC